MKWFAGLRALAFLRRTTIALESLARSASEYLAIERARTEADLGRRWRKGAKVSTDIGTLDIAAANKSWHAEREAAMVEESAEDYRE